MSKIMLGVSYGIYEGNPWGKCHYYESAVSNSTTTNLGYVVKSKKCNYNTAVEIAKRWNEYELSEVNVYFGEHDRIDHVELSGD